VSTAAPVPEPAEGPVPEPVEGPGASPEPVDGPVPEPVAAPVPEPVEGTHARVRDAARERGLDIEIRQRPAANSLQEAAALLGLDPSGIVKTLVVKRSDAPHAPSEHRSALSGASGARGPRFLFALIPGGRKISWPKLRAVVGVNRLKLPDPAVALEATGYERGTIVPIGSTSAWPVFADETIRGRRIAMGAGAHGYSLFVDADALITAYGATVADISEPE